MSTTRTTCPYCGVGCGVLATTRADRVDITGDPQHPANFGRLCSKGTALGETLSFDDRLLHPFVDGASATWNSALDHVARRFSDTIATHGPDSVAFYVSGQILTEDYYVANKLMKGFIGSANIDTNSRLCMASSVAGHRRAFGSDTVPGTYEDLDEADLVVLVGSNLAWCHPVLFQRLEVARAERGTKIVVIDPRETATCAIADLHLAVKPGSDVALFNGLLQHIAAAGALDRAFVWRHTSGLLAALKAAQPLTLKEIVKATGLKASDIEAFYDLFLQTEKTVTAYSQGVNQSTSGTDKVNAIINCHLATGRIGKLGMGPFSVTGQPNAMGGREVGGLANMLAAHMNIEDAEHRALVQRFWQSPRIATKPGFKAVDMFRAVADGRIKALWIMATNPVDSMPDADLVRAALKACPLVVVSDVVANTDTTAHAHVLLPALAWGEKDGTVTNSERRISRQRAFLPPPGEARADWWQMAEVAKRMGFADAFSYANAAQIFAEYARLTASDNNGTRDLDIGAFADVSSSDYDALEPVQWPRPANGPARTRFFANGNFYTTDRRARFVPTPYRPLAEPHPAFPFRLNTGRIRDQWHTMTRTAKAPRLMSHISEPYIEIHPNDALRCGLAAETLAQVSSPSAHVIVRVRVTDRQQPGTVFVPMHWTDQAASNARINALVTGDVDPVSGQPGLKQSTVAVKLYPAAWYGLAITFEPMRSAGIDYVATARVPGGWRTELAGITTIGDASQLLQRFADADDDTDMVTYVDRNCGHHRVAMFRNDQLIAALFIAPEPLTISRAWANSLLVEPHGADLASRHRVLAGRPSGAVRDRGAIVCACFDVGSNDIVAAITSGCSTIAAVGTAVKAGTNCGSCRSEIGKMLHEHARAIEPQLSSANFKHLQTSALDIQESGDTRTCRSPGPR